VYGIGRFDVNNNFTYSDHPLPNSYYGVWCGNTAGELVVVMSRRPNSDPEQVGYLVCVCLTVFCGPISCNKPPSFHGPAHFSQVHEFYIQTISTSTWTVNNITTVPVVSPADETMPVADGIFDYDAKASTMWLSWRLNSRPYLNSGITHVVDLSTKTDNTFYTPKDEGYLVNAHAVAGAAKTWGVLRSFHKRPSGKEVISLTLADVSLANGEVEVKKVRDISHAANSDDLPFGECVQMGHGGTSNITTLYMMNVDETDFLHPWFNMSAIDAATGQVHWNLDSSIIVGQKFAYVTGFACV
jgi:hypothetical protein